MKKAYIEYELSLKNNSRLLRNNSTLSEVLLWKRLRAGSMLGFKFNRQKPLAEFIVDFYCKPLNLVIEIDGSSHDNIFEKDEERDSKLQQLGLTVLRFTDKQVKTDMNNVLRAIEIWITEHNPQIPLTPPFQAGN